MTPSIRRRLWVLIILGGLIRVVFLPMLGTTDVRTWKAWSFVGATDVTGIYGIGGTPPERGVIRWQDVYGAVDYPPVSIYELAIVGRVYLPADPDYDDTPLLTALIKAPGLVAEGLLVLALLTWGRRAIGQSAAVWMAMAVWLNPAVILNGAALGYLDAQMAVPAVLALLAAGTGRPGLAGVLAAVAVLTKAQAVVIGPAVLLALVRQEHIRRAKAITLFLIAGLGTAFAVAVPFILRGGFWNMVQAVGRLGSQDTLSGQALNVWWIVTWLLRSIYAIELGVWEAFTGRVRILEISRLTELGYVGVKPAAAVVVVSIIAWSAWRARHERHLGAWAFLGGSSVFTYFMWNTQVHENHLYLAVIMFGLAAAVEPRWRRMFWAVSALTAFNMYIFYGVGTGLSPVLGRHWTMIDLTVIASGVGVWVWGLSLCSPARQGLSDLRPPDSRP